MGLPFVRFSRDGDRTDEMSLFLLFQKASVAQPAPHAIRTTRPARQGLT